MKIVLGALMATAFLSPASAQSTDATARSPQDEYQRGYAATPMPNQGAINASGAAAVDQLNGQALADSQTGQAASHANQAQYDADRAAYMNALARHDRAVDRTDARYRHQQNAYADAMTVWRAQVIACKHGHRRACNMPAPNPAAFY